MSWLNHLIYLLIIAMETFRTQHVEYEQLMENTNRQLSTNEDEYTGFKKDVKKLSSYSEWARWSACQAGRKTRRRHCLRRRICGDSLRIEVTRCGNIDTFGKNLRDEVSEQSTHFNEQHVRFVELNGTTDMKVRHLESQVNQMNIDVQKKFRGFSPWSTWSPCSRKCVTVRRSFRPLGRQTMHPLIPHQETNLLTLLSEKAKRPHNIAVVRPTHALCLYNNRLARLEAMPPPAPAIHPEDSRSYKRATPPCGRLGRYRGSPGGRIRARMSDMIRIIGGRPAPPGKWTWQVAVLNRYKEAFCGGTLISLRWVVTAAHCVRRRLYVRLGEHDLLVRNYGELEMKVTEAVIHPLYDPDTVVNDVAMLRLPAPARPDLGHGLACLPEPYQTLPPHTTCVILGWGKKRPTDVHGTRILHEAQVSTIQQGVCRRSYWQYAITDNMVCAGRGHHDSCAGDSGGPLLCRDHTMRYYLQGITSFGDGCGKRGKYGIYTRTAGYVSWMNDVMRNNYFDD